MDLIERITALRGGRPWQFGAQPHCTHCKTPMSFMGTAIRSAATARAAYFTCTKACRRCGRFNFCAPLKAQDVGPAPEPTQGPSHDPGGGSPVLVAA